MPRSHFQIFWNCAAGPERTMKILEGNKMNIGINGVLGRIGKPAFEELVKLGLKVTAVNDVSYEKIKKELLDFDRGTHKRPDLPLEVEGNKWTLKGEKLHVFSEKDITKIPWDSAGVELVVDTTGSAALDGHMELYDAEGDLVVKTNVKQVVTCAPFPYGFNLMMGVNHTSYDPEEHAVASNGSCSSKAASLPLKVIKDHGYKLLKLEIDGDHSATNSQRALEVANNIEFHGTGAINVLQQVFPELKTKRMEKYKNGLKGVEFIPYVFGGVSRVGTSNGSFMRLHAIVAGDDDISTSKLHSWLREAACAEKYQQRLAVIDEGSPGLQHIVNEEYSRFSSVIVLPETRVLHSSDVGSSFDCDDPHGPFEIHLSFKIGYDNEKGSAMDLALLTSYIIQRREKIETSRL
jgi:hypothetical protein